MGSAQTCSGRHNPSRVDVMQGAGGFAGAGGGVLTVADAQADQGNAQPRFGQHFRDQAADAAVDVVFFDGDHPARAAQGLSNTSRCNGRIDDRLMTWAWMPCSASKRGSVHRFVDHRAQGDDGQVLALAQNVHLPGQKW